MAGPGIGVRTSSFLLTIATIALVPHAARAQRADESFPVVNGDVTAMIVHGQTLYLGGDFTSIGAYTGGGVPLDASGEALSGFPTINGRVTAVASDGQGGWFVAGTFDSVGGLPRSRLAQIRSNLTVSSWNPGTDGYVSAIAVANGFVYIGGRFTSVGGHPRSCLAAINATGAGSVTSWAPTVSGYGSVSAIVVSGNTVYVGGDFVAIGSATRYSLAAIATSGFVLPWSPGSLSCGINSCSTPQIYCMAVSGSTVYVGGNFSFVGGQNRSNLAALDISTGQATGWNPTVDAYVSTIAVHDGTVYLGGLFSSLGQVGSQVFRNGLAAVDSASGNPTAWNPLVSGTLGPPYGGWVHDLAIDGSSLYFGGRFTGVGSVPRANLAAVDLATGLATSWNPSGFAPVDCVSAGNGTVFAGAVSTNVNGLERHHIAAVDLSTGQAKPWDPGADRPVRALAMIAGTLYAGGEFLQIGAQQRQRLAALDTLTGYATSWDPSVNDVVHALATDGATLYAGGKFNAVGLSYRPGIAAIDPATGVATAWTPGGTAVTVQALALGESQVFVGGDFVGIAGQIRRSVAALDRVTGQVQAWNAQYCDAPVNALLQSGSAIHVGGAFSSIAGASRYGAAALDTADAKPTSWNPLSNGYVTSLAESPGVIYLGGVGYFRSSGQLNGTGAVTTSGARIAWNPILDATARAIAVSEGRVFAGGSFTQAAGRSRAYLASLPAATVPRPPGPSLSIGLSHPVPNPMRTHGGVDFYLQHEAVVWLDVFDLSGRLVRHVIEGVRYSAGTHTAPITLDGMKSGLYLVDLRAGGERVSRRLAFVP